MINYKELIKASGFDLTPERLDGEIVFFGVAQNSYNPTVMDMSVRRQYELRVREFGKNSRFSGDIYQWVVEHSGMDVIVEYSDGEKKRFLSSEFSERVKKDFGDS